jgi:hypothetical protein
VSQNDDRVVDGEDGDRVDTDRCQLPFYIEISGGFATASRASSICHTGSKEHFSDDIPQNDYKLLSNYLQTFPIKQKLFQQFTFLQLIKYLM